MKGMKASIGVEKVFEEQMRKWELQRSLDRTQDAKERPEAQKFTFVTLSFELGSQGEQVTQELQQLTDWQVYDKEILDYMAKDLHVHRQVLASLDERRMGIVEECLDTFSGDRVPGYYSYKHHLMKVLMVIAHHGNAIIIGRAAGMVLPRQAGLSTRIVAPLQTRSARYAQETDIELPRAQEVVADYDHRQKKFVKDFVHKDISDPVHYDLVINTEHINPPAAAKVIHHALQTRNG